ncbi:MAG: ABC transporter, partial [Amphiamblys sp. WSBS2006]
MALKKKKNKPTRIERLHRLKKLGALFYRSLSWKNISLLLLSIALTVTEKYVGTEIPEMCDKVGKHREVAPYRRAVTEIVAMKFLEVTSHEMAHHIGYFAYASLAYNFKLKLFAMFMETDLDYHINRSGPETTGYLIRAGTYFYRLVEAVIERLIPTILQLCFTVPKLRKYGSKEVNIFLGLVSAFVLVTCLFVEFRTVYVKRRSRQSDKALAGATETFENYEATMLYCNQEKEKQKYRLREKRFYSLNKKVELITSAMKHTQKFFLLANILVFAYGKPEEDIKNGNNKRSLNSLMLYLTKLFGQLTTMGSFYYILMTSLANLDVSVEIEEQLEEFEIRNRRRTQQLIVSEGVLRFVGVGFSTSSFSVSNLNLTFTPGVTALIGQSGTGKTTITKFMVGITAPKEGTVEIDGTNILDVTPESLLSQVSIITQNIFLFNESLLENIRYARIDATDEEV